MVVLGMHRSGTSALTRGLQVMGVDLGDRMMPPNENINAKGFWEDLDLNTLNIEMLSAINSDWHHVSHIEARDVEALHKAGYFPRAVELLRAKVGNSLLFAFKDPRVAKLLPFWKEVFSHCQFNVSYVLAVRHPLSVAKSLAKRDGFDVGKSYLLWLGHVITSLTGSAGNQRVLVDYDYLMRSPDHELHRIAKKLDLTIDPAELQSYKSEFLDEGLRHTVYGLNDLLSDDACPPLVREVYKALLAVASDQILIDDLDFQHTVIRWGSEFERLQAILILVDKLSKANQVVDELDEQIAHSRAFNWVQSKQAEREEEIDSLNKAMAGRDERIASLNRAVNDREEQIVKAKAESRVKFFRAMAEFEGQVNMLQERVNSLVAEQEKILNSTSWKITKPLRVVVSNLRNLKREKQADDER